MSWEALLGTALVGTARRPFAPAAVAAGAVDAAAALVAQLDPADPEGALLGAAAAFALRRRAGALPVAAPASPLGPAPADERPRCSPRAGAILARVLEGEHGELLAEWLDLAARAGVRPPEEQLPALLEAGGARALRPALRAAVGARGRWLAAQLEQWAWATGIEADADADLVWQTGARPARLALLERLRGGGPDDRACARALLAGTWSEESAEDRAAIARALATGLEDADEPFLEQALDDRRREVRRAAAELLAVLPSSRLAARMVARARAHVRRVGGRLEVEPPERVDAATARDGVDPTPPPGGGARAAWLRQILAATPLGIWGDPRAVTRQAAREGHPDLLAGWAAAATRQRDGAWAEALLELALAGAEVVPLSLVSVLPAHRREALLLVAFRAAAAGRIAGDAALDAATLCEPPLGLPLSRAVLAELERQVARGGGDGPPRVRLARARALLQVLARRLAPAIADELPPAPLHRSGWEDALAGIRPVLSFRRAMADALAPAPEVPSP